MKSFISIFAIAALSVVPAVWGQGDTSIYSPPNGSTLQPGQTVHFAFNTGGQLKGQYILTLSRVQPGGMDVLWMLLDNPYLDYTVPTSTGPLYARGQFIWCQQGSCNWRNTTDAAYNIQQTAVNCSITAPTTGTTLVKDQYGSIGFAIATDTLSTATSGPTHYTMGYDGPGSNAYQQTSFNLALNPPTSGFTNGLIVNNDVHLQLWIRLYCDNTPGNYHDYQYYTPGAPPVSTMNLYDAGAQPTTGLTDWWNEPDQPSAKTAKGGIMPTAPTNTRTLHLTKGTIEVGRGDMLNPGAVAYSWSGAATDNEHTYTWSFDTTDVAHIRLGGPDKYTLGRLRSEQPNGWLVFGTGWSAFKAPSRATNATYTMVSSLRPGLIPIYLQSDFDGTVAAINGKPGPSGVDHTLSTGSLDNRRIASAASIFNNSKVVYAIGPVFPQDVTQEQVLSEVSTWVSAYGMAFLRPLLDNTGAGLDAITPTNSLERDVVSALRGVLQ